METQYCVVVERPIEDVEVPHYTDEEHGTWALLLKKQASLVPGRACVPFLNGLHAVNFPQTQIPKLRDISEIVQSKTGWKIIRVDGLVHPSEFFQLLGRRIFPSTDFIRKRSELDYTPAPDMFHDLFGHVPLLTDPDFTEFFETFGLIGGKAAEKYPADHKVHEQLHRIYWFTVEFGLIQTQDGLRAYGSGSVSSPQELEFCVGDKCRKHPFDINVVSQRNYDIWHLQEDVFVVNSFAELGQSFRSWAKQFDLL